VRKRSGNSQHEPFGQLLRQRRGGVVFSSLKKERIRRRIYRSREEARVDVFGYIEVFYNRIRRHSHLGKVSPHDFDQAALTQA
jgi:transposase InsO family protein